MYKPYSHLYRRIEPLFLVALLVLVTLFTYSPQLGADLDIRQDDHRIIFAGSTSPTHEQVRRAEISIGYSIQPTMEWALVSDLHSGRFRPITQVLEILLPRSIGADALRWHTIMLALAGITCAALFVAALSIPGSARVAALFALMVMLGPDPGPARVWYMMATKAEAVGTLFLAFAIIAISRAALGKNKRTWDGGALLFALLAGLTKESFVLVIPALATLRIWLESKETQTTEWQSLRSLKRLMAAYAGIFLALSTAIALTLSIASVESYGGATFRSSSVFSEGLYLTLSQFPSQSVWFVPVILSGYTLARLYGPTGALKTAAPVLILAVLWVVPQVLLYSARGGMWDHYWLPCAIGIAGLNAAAIAYLSDQKDRWLFAIAIIAVVIWIGNGIRVNFQTVSNFAERTHARQEALLHVAQRISNEGKILVIGDGRRDSEYSFSWIFFLGHERKPHSQVYFYDTRSEYRGQFSTSLFFPYGGKLSDTSACQFDALIFLSEPQEDDSDWRTWYRETCHKVYTFSRPQRYLSVKSRGWTTGEFSITVATKIQSAGNF